MMRKSPQPQPQERGPKTRASQRAIYTHTHIAIFTRQKTAAIEKKVYVNASARNRRIGASSRIGRIIVVDRERRRRAAAEDDVGRTRALRHFGQTETYSCTRDALIRVHRPPG